MTDSRASPMRRRVCVSCQTKFLPKRPDAEFCSNRQLECGRGRPGIPRVIVATCPLPDDECSPSMETIVVGGWSRTHRLQVG